MTKNVGSIDKYLRIFVGVALLAYAFSGQNWWALIGIVPLATAFMGSCPVYSIFGMSTCPIDKSKKA